MQNKLCIKQKTDAFIKITQTSVCMCVCVINTYTEAEEALSDSENYALKRLNISKHFLFFFFKQKSLVSSSHSTLWLFFVAGCVALQDASERTFCLI